MSNNIKMSRADLSLELDACHAMACFLAESINLILEEHGGFITDLCPVPFGAGQCMDALADRIKAISQKI